MLAVKLLLLPVLAIAKPHELQDKKLGTNGNTAVREARSGDLRFLCHLLCESVEESSESDYDYPFDGTFLCEELCQTPGVSSTTLKPTSPHSIPSPSATPSSLPQSSQTPPLKTSTLSLLPSTESVTTEAGEDKNKISVKEEKG